MQSTTVKLLGKREDIYIKETGEKEAQKHRGL